MDKSHPISYKVVSLSVGSLFAIGYVLCVLFGIVFPNQLYQQLFKMLPGFKWLDITSFLLGLIEAFVYGLFIGALFTAFNKNPMKYTGGHSEH